MNANELPRFDPNAKIIIKGETLNKLATAIQKRTPIAGAGLSSTPTPRGVVIKVQ